jgi:hypothetical protein
MRRQYFFLPTTCREKNLHALRATRFLQKKYAMIAGFISTMVLYRHINIIDREAIDVFFAGRLVPSKRSEVAGVGRQKGLRPSAFICG